MNMDKIRQIGDKSKKPLEVKVVEFGLVESRFVASLMTKPELEAVLQLHRDTMLAKEADALVGRLLQAEDEAVEAMDLVREIRLGRVWYRACLRMHRRLRRLPKDVTVR